MELRGARVLITGASKGIGAEMARHFAAAGSEVVLSARTESAIVELATELGGHAVPFDAADRSSVDGFIDRAEAAAGPIDVLINNAGIETSQLIEDTDEDDIERAIRINLITPEQLTRQMLPRMLDRGRGHLVYTSSVAATIGQAGMSVYCSTKGGLTRFAEAVRGEMKNTPIGVTILHLGPIDTEMWDRLEDEAGMQRVVERGIKLGAMTKVRPETVAAETVKAVQKGRREVRLPKRMAGGAFLNGLNTRSFEALGAGIDPRAEFGK